MDGEGIGNAQEQMMPDQQMMDQQPANLNQSDQLMQ